MIKSLLEFAEAHYGKITIISLVIFLVEITIHSWLLSIGNVDIVGMILIVGLQVCVILNLISLVGLGYKWYKSRFTNKART